MSAFEFLTLISIPGLSSPSVDCTNILWAAFAPIFFCQKIQSQTVRWENLLVKCWWNWQLVLPQPAWCGGTASCSSPWWACGSSVAAAARPSSRPPWRTKMLAEDSSFFRRTLEMNSNKICNVHKISYYRKQPRLLFFDVFSEELSLTESKKRVIFFITKQKTQFSLLLLLFLSSW